MEASTACLIQPRSWRPDSKHQHPLLDIGNELLTLTAVILKQRDRVVDIIRTDTFEDVTNRLLGFLVSEDGL